MKVICLNVWGGRKTKEIFDFVRTHESVDIFCFEEVYDNAHGKDTIWLDGTNFDFLEQIKKVLENYTCIYHPHLGDWWGLAMFIKKGIEVVESGEVYVHQQKGFDMSIEVYGHTAKNIQYAVCSVGEKKVTVAHMHGLWNGKGKGDTPERITQSENVCDFIRKQTGGCVLLGDLNLSPDTRSIKIIEDTPCRNLIKEYGITSTRSSHYAKDNKYADYAFVTPDIAVDAFAVLSDEVADHLPLFLEFH
jgi:exonuclease III